MIKNALKWLIRVLVIGAIGVGGYLFWKDLQPRGLGDGYASGNGRIEATEIDVATKLAGRVAELMVDEGDFVTVGQVLGQMDTDVLEAQLAEANAQVQKAENCASDGGGNSNSPGEREGDRRGRGRPT